MVDWNAEYAIESIQRKLCEQRPLTENEIHMVVSALRKQHDYTQKPYYEVVYHDEYDRQEKRIMNPISHTVGTVPGEQYLIVSDGFELHFNRILRRNRDSENE
jgi:hypothetical protein